MMQTCNITDLRKTHTIIKQTLIVFDSLELQTSFQVF